MHFTKAFKNEPMAYFFNPLYINGFFLLVKHNALGMDDPLYIPKDCRLLFSKLNYMSFSDDHFGFLKQ